MYIVRYDTWNFAIPMYSKVWIRYETIRQHRTSLATTDTDEVGVYGELESWISNIPGTLNTMYRLVRYIEVRYSDKLIKINIISNDAVVIMHR